MLIQENTSHFKPEILEPRSNVRRRFNSMESRMTETWEKLNTFIDFNERKIIHYAFDLKTKGMLVPVEIAVRV
jgi:hypothetical protein